MSARPARTRPEWITFGVSVAILLGLVGLIGRDYLDDERPADPVASVVGPARRVGDRHVVTVEIENRGDQPALLVQVITVLKVGDDEIDAEQVVEEVAGSATEEVEVVLPRDPADGELTTRVASFQHP